MAIYDNQGGPAWLNFQQAPMPRRNLDRMMTLFEKQEQKQKQYKPDMSAYKTALDNIDAMAGDRAYLTKQYNDIMTELSVRSAPYGNNWLQFIQSKEYNEIQNKLNNFIYGVANAGQSKYEHDKSYASLESEGALDQYALIDGKPIVNPDGTFRTNRDHMNTLWSQPNFDGDLIGKVSFDSNTGSVRDATTELGTIFKAVGASTGTPQWNNINNMGEGIGEAFKTITSSPWGSSNIQQLDSAVETVLTSGMSPKALYGLKQAYLAEVEANKDNEKYGKDFNEFAYDFIHNYAKSFVEMDLGMPKSGKSGSSGEGDFGEMGYFKSAEFASTAVNDPNPTEKQEVIQTDGGPAVGSSKVWPQLIPETARKELYKPGTRLVDITDHAYILDYDNDISNIPGAVVLETPSKANGRLKFWDGAQGRWRRPANTKAYLPSPTNPDRLVTEEEYAAEKGWFGVEERVRVAIPDVEAREIFGWDVKDQAGGATAVPIAEASFPGARDTSDEFFDRVEEIGRKDLQKYIEAQGSDWEGFVPDKTSLWDLGWNTYDDFIIVEANFFREPAQKFGDPAGASLNYAGNELAALQKNLQERIKDTYLDPKLEEHLTIK